MKLSEMNTVELSKALCNLAGPVGNLASDKLLIDALAAMRPEEETTVGAWLARSLAPIAPVLLDKHIDDVCAIASALSGKTVDEVKAQKGLVTIRDLVDCIDKDLIDFFKSSAGSGRTGSPA